jgi:hypothetical protein
MAPLCRSAAIKSFGQFEPALPASVQQRQVNLVGATNRLHAGEKGGFYTEGGQTQLRCVESGYAYKNNRLLAAEASPAPALGRQ